MIDFGGIMKVRMYHLGIKHEVLAKQLNIARSTVTAYCNNTRQPDLDTIAKICKILEIDFNWFIHIDEQDHSAMIVRDDVEMRLLELYRICPKHKRTKVMNAVTFLIEECFIDEDEQEQNVKVET